MSLLLVFMICMESLPKDPSMGEVRFVLIIINQAALEGLDNNNVILESDSQVVVFAFFNYDLPSSRVAIWSLNFISEVRLFLNLIPIYLFSSFCLLYHSPQLNKRKKKEEKMCSNWRHLTMQARFYKWVRA